MTDLGMLLAGGSGMRMQDMTRLAAAAEAAGFSGVHMVEAWRSAPACLAALATPTKTARIGPHVMNAHARSPMIAGAVSHPMPAIG